MGIVLGGVLSVARPSTAQTAPLPPARADSDYLLQLALPLRLAERQVRYETRYRWSNNVLPMLQAEQAGRKARTVGTGAPFYLTDNLARLEFHSGRWRGEYASGTVLEASGNRDAAQLWLDVEAKATDPARLYRPFARERRGEWEWWGIGYQTPLRTGGIRGFGSVGLRYLRCRRYREGWIAGTALADHLTGEVRFFSSRGIGLEAPVGQGAALDLIASLEWASDWRGLLAVEGLLGSVRWPRLRQVNAQADTAAFLEDPEGFIRTLPIVTGQEEVRSLRRRLDRQVAAGVARTEGKRVWALLYTDRIGEPRWHLSFMQGGRAGRWLFADLQLPRPVFAFGYHQREWDLTLSLSHLDAWKATTLGLEVGVGKDW